MLDKVTKETFEPMTGGQFELAVGDRRIPLELFAVLGTGLKGVANREQFALHFRGPASPPLAQRTYRVAHAALGEFDLFLVPIKRDATGMTYEAVFT